MAEKTYFAVHLKCGFVALLAQSMGCSTGGLAKL